ncbi:MAG TPA: hypothetical protein VF233_01825, partial [Nitrososphaeraceae archaeon]
LLLILIKVTADICFSLNNRNYPNIKGLLWQANFLSVVTSQSFCILIWSLELKSISVNDSHNITTMKRRSRLRMIMANNNE